MLSLARSKVSSPPPQREREVVRHMETDTKEREREREREREIVRHTETDTKQEREG